MIGKHFLLIGILFLASILHGQDLELRKSNWIDSVMGGMTIEEKIGQLFVIRSYSQEDEVQKTQVVGQIEKYHIGGVCFFKGTSAQLFTLQQVYQRSAKIPLLISIDAEWGPGMRLTDGIQYPKQLTLGAIENNGLIYKMAFDNALHLKKLGIHLNFAPVVDINTNPQNPVINERSFGNQKLNVTAKSFAYMKGLQDGGVLACAKHFPGHGDTDVDSHNNLPVCLHSLQRLDSIELLPFQILQNQDIASIMVGHLQIPALDSTPNLPATLSHKIVEGILRDRYNYKGLIITDALEMKGLSQYFNAGNAALLAFKAGNDILLLSDDVGAAYDTLLQAYKNNEISEVQINEKVKRILHAKCQVGLHMQVQDTIHFKMDSFANRNSLALVEKLYRHALTLWRDDDQLVPIRKYPNRMISISLGTEGIGMFQKRINDYTNCTPYSFTKSIQFTDQQKEEIQQADLVVLSIHNLNYKPSKNFGIQEDDIQTLIRVLDKRKTILVIFGNPYIAKRLEGFKSILLAYENNETMQDIAAQMLFGSDPIQGTPPLDLSFQFEQQVPLRRPSLFRLGYSLPESVGINSDSLARIDQLVAELIQTHASPGCQVLVAKQGKIIYQKAYGYFTYDSLQPVDNNTLYDLASLTKILATAPALMLMQDHNQFEPRRKFSEYFPELKQTNKENLNFKEFLLHQGKLVPWIPFYKSTLFSPDTLNIINWEYYRKVPSDSFPTQVTDSLYIRFDFRDSIFSKIIQSQRFEEVKYRYSDVGFYFIPRLIEKLSGLAFSSFLRRNFFEPIGMSKTCFTPLMNGYTKDQIAPSEDDQYFRHQVIQGYVHDMGAALMGGVSGHAGMFSTATDVAKMMQFYISQGNVGGEEIISWNTMGQYMDRDQVLKRRGLAFDLMNCDTTDMPYVSCLASPFTFGHRGFTGTCAWADPKNEIIFIFLSNRTYPSAKVNHLHNYGYRTRIHDIIYQSIISG